MKFREYIIKFIKFFYKFININLKFIVAICEINIIKFFEYKIKYIEITRFIFNKYILNNFNVNFNIDFNIKKIITRFYYNINFILIFFK